MNVLVTPGGHRAFTIADVERMVTAGILDSDERIELIAGALVPMSAKGSSQEAIKTGIVLRWGRSCPPGFAFSPETGLRLAMMQDDPFSPCGTRWREAAAA